MKTETLLLLAAGAAVAYYLLRRRGGCLACKDTSAPATADAPSSEAGGVFASGQWLPPDSTAIVGGAVC